MLALALSFWGIRSSFRWATRHGAIALELACLVLYTPILLLVPESSLGEVLGLEQAGSPDARVLSCCGKGQGLRAEGRWGQDMEAGGNLGVPYPAELT